MSTLGRFPAVALSLTSKGRSKDVGSASVHLECVSAKVVHGRSSLTIGNELLSESLFVRDVDGSSSCSCRFGIADVGRVVGKGVVSLPFVLGRDGGNSASSSLGLNRSAHLVDVGLRSLDQLMLEIVDKSSAYSVGLDDFLFSIAARDSHSLGAETGNASETAGLGVAWTRRHAAVLVSELDDNDVARLDLRDDAGPHVADDGSSGGLEKGQSKVLVLYHQVEAYALRAMVDDGS